MKRVLLDRGGVFRLGVALDAGCVAAHVRLELVDRVAVVHRVATHARHRALGVAGAHPHGGELAAAGKDRAVVPPAFAEESAVLLKFLLPHRRGGRAGVLDVVADEVDVVAGAVRWAVAGELVTRFFILVNVNAVTLAADLAGALVIELGRVDDLGGRAVAELFRVAGKRCAVMVGVPGGGAVAGLAGDAQLGGARVERVFADEAGVAGSAVALDAVVVPLRNHALAVGRCHEGVVARDPLLLLGQENQRQGLEQVAVLGFVRLGLSVPHAALDPVGLVMVRAGGHDDSLVDSRDTPQVEHRQHAVGADLVGVVVDAPPGLDGFHDDLGIGHLRPVLVVGLVDAIQQAAGHDLGAVEPTHDGVCAGELGHRAVKTLVPTVVLRGVAGAATGGRCVALGFILPRGQG